eukprot:TRINITY_DN5902_c0_g1_i2.p1 TRINITY_DN5902_c0_g1~~TRINITY_DN5902_c0_g1_i2.p1  ORF type:complete len:698 (+),score=111.96 TRINITY_DN5902_c0_g1_i2:81-2174(+)
MAQLVRTRLTTSVATEEIERLAESGEVAAFVGDVVAAHLAARTRAVYAALGGSDGDALVAAVRELTRDCVTLPEWIEYDRSPEAASQEEFCWTFGDAIAACVAAGVAATAGLSEQDLIPGQADGAIHVAAVLEDLGQELDCLAPYIFGGLCRIEQGAGLELLLTPGKAVDEADALMHEQSLIRALRLICAWALAAVCRAVGVERLTPCSLWEFASRDYFWVVLLAKGVLTLDARHACENDGRILTMINAPADIQAIQGAVLDAVLGLASPDVAFAREHADASVEGADENGGISIMVRAAELAEHRARLAAAWAELQLLGPVTSLCGEPAVDGVHRASRLASLLVTLLLPWSDAQDGNAAPDPAWCGVSFTAWGIVDFARRSAAELLTCVYGLIDDIWRVLVLGADAYCSLACFPRGFLQDCASLAFIGSDVHAKVSLEPDTNVQIARQDAHISSTTAARSAEIVSIFLRGCDAGESRISDPLNIAAVCALCINAGLGPLSFEESSTVNPDEFSAFEGLLTMVKELPAATRAHVTSLVTNWRRPLRRHGLERWSELIGASTRVGQLEENVAQEPIEIFSCNWNAADQMEMATRANVVDCSDRPGLLRSGGTLRDLLYGAPPELSCCLDGRLLVDPVRCPRGHTYERGILAAALSRNGNSCPQSGLPLCLSECVRDFELRRRAAEWARHQRRAGARPVS